jgi:2-succinyl-5-enolpyruvyl-6-hydroxy-3-cyclohexene-1-carboxylate synthase
MYSDIKSIQILVSLLKAYNIKHLVLSPGNRNVPFVHSVENDPFFKCYSIVDERSAAFFALGLIQELKLPVAISCTSGTASCNYMSAVTEAYYQKLSLVVITADRNPYYLNQHEDQIIPQVSLFNQVCKKSVHLPIVENDTDYWYCQRLVNEVLLEVNHHGCGPVHINIPIEKGIMSFNTRKLPVLKAIKRTLQTDDDEVWMNKVNELKDTKKILIIYGQNPPISLEEKNIIEQFTQKYNCVIAVDHLSNMKCKGTIETFTSSRLLTIELFNKLLPEIVITMNGNYVSYIRSMLKQNSGKFKHWLVSEEGVVADQFQSLTDILECSSSFFFKFFVEKGKSSTQKNSYYEDWVNTINNFKLPDFTYSDLYAVQNFMKAIPPNSLVHLANSSSVRLAQHFELDESVTVYCNRGTNGIDGSFSSFIGQSSVSNRLSFLLIGDLSFFYDMNAIWNRHVGKNIRILLNNNEGASIFHFTLGIEKIATLDMHTAAEHFAIAKNWVESMGFKYYSASNKEEFDMKLPFFMSGDSDKPILFEVFTKKDENAKILHKFYDMNKTGIKANAINAIKTIKSVLDK